MPSHPFVLGSIKPVYFLTIYAMATVLELLESKKYDNPDVTESPTILDDEMMAPN